MADFSTVARPYAKAIFDVAQAAQNLGGWSRALAGAAEIVNNPAAKQFLGRPELRSEQRVEFMTQICSGSDDTAPLATGDGRNLIRLLSENDRLSALAEISAQFDQLKSDTENKIKVTLVSATDAEQAMTAKVTQALERKLGRQVELVHEVDGTLVGGAVIRAKDMVIDGSVQTRLKRLAAALID